MKTDIARLMEANSLDGILILGSTRHNPDMYYFTRGGHVTFGALLIEQGHPGVLYSSSMERDEAAQSGLEVRLLEPLVEYLRQAGGDYEQAEALRLGKVLEGAGVTTGHLAIAGITAVGPVLEVVSRLEAVLPGLVISGLCKDSVIRQAMATKDDTEIQRIRRMGKITADVVGNVADFLSEHRSKDGVLVKADGQPLTVGDVKHRINRDLAGRGAENPHGTIFAPGRDAAVPHSAGVDAAPVPVGETIVFDIFPCEGGGGYFYDFTRTWCLGYASEEVQALHQDVQEVLQGVVGKLEVGGLCETYQDLSCDLFEARRHPTIRSDPAREEGYTHSIGHGLGLYVHELPHFGQLATEDDILAPGAVFTIEPGLYYPERGMGVRIENTYHVSPEGEIEALVDYPLDLVLPVAG